ncbi:class II aldolase/adducin family protein [Paenibacillus albus]|uniref:Class II aldolase/adducin family protein n=1 Tax=Paenibacillus albus TaxID=2495582 RepID=A0A3S9A6C6_9BACL|nr:class II aldolase/adducin family protein [Paenibacillus albus]AZN41278.1 class II aldolase/adducin family protein [Paenibacillus albus]
MDMNMLEARERVVRAGRKLVESRLIARTWGNVSCRISDSHFVITPRGRDYLQMTAEDIVQVAISDCSYSGDVKPSSEKAMHAAVYKQYPEVNFVIHTHQENASVVSAAGLSSMKVEGDYLLLGGEVIVADYALPTTKKLARKVSNVLRRTNGQAVILAKHGALCFGAGDDETFQVASELETACADFITKQYRLLSGNASHSSEWAELSRYAVSRLIGKAVQPAEVVEAGYHFESERNETGFNLKLNNGATMDVKLNELDSSMPEEAKLLNEIYQSFNEINYVIHTNSLSVSAMSHADITVRPLLDDFAQLVGTSAKIVPPMDAPRIRAALKNASAVLLHQNGALCCGSNRSDASAVAMVLEKNCKALIGASLFGPIKPIHKLESWLMRFMYLQSYSKQAAKKS